MSYTPEDQYLYEPLSQLIGAIGSVRGVITRRLVDISWTTEHQEELMRLDVELLRLAHRLVKLRKETQ